MKDKQGEKWKLIAEKCENMSPEECRAHNVRHTVCDSTWSSYASAARNMIRVHMGLSEEKCRLLKMQPPKWRNVRDIKAGEAMHFIAHNVTRDFFSMFLHAQSTEGLRNLKTARTALAKAQEVFGTPIWAKSAEVILEVDGATTSASMATKKPPSIGAIDEHMVKSLQTALKSKGLKSMAKAVAVQFGAALRYSELKKIRASDVRKKGLYIRKSKQDRARSSHKHKPKLKRLAEWSGGREALRILRKKARKADAEDLLFPSWKWRAEDLNREIRKIGKAHQWSKEIRIRGSHSLRHGGVGLAVNQLKGKYRNKQVAKILLMSEKMLDLYKRPNQERIDLDFMKEATRLEWLATHRRALEFPVGAPVHTQQDAFFDYNKYKINKSLE